MRQAALALVAGLAVTPASADCKLALVLGLDVSSSVNAKEYRLQLGGLAAALRQEAVQAAILTPPGQSVAAYAFEWSAADHQAEIAGWALLDSPGAIAAFADRIDAHARTRSDGATAVGAALAHGARAFDRAPACARRTIDLSGDGPTNDGPAPAAVRATGLLDGITVNGLFVQMGHPDPAIHYREEVIQGPGAFLALARDFLDYPPVIAGKLIEEIARQPLLGRAAVGQGGSDPG